MSNVRLGHLPCNSDYIITSPFGYRVNPITGQKSSHHQGGDFVTQDGIIYATNDGVVVRSANMPDKINGYGNYVVIWHPKYGYCDLSAHMRELILNENDVVKCGQIIGYMGETGAATGIHLHYEIEPIEWCHYWDKENGIRKYAIDPLIPMEECSMLLQKIELLEKKVEELEKANNRYHNISEMPIWLVDHVKKLVDNGIIKGNENGDLDMSLDMLRNQIIFTRLLNKFKEELNNGK